MTPMRWGILGCVVVQLAQQVPWFWWHIKNRRWPRGPMFGFMVAEYWFCGMVFAFLGGN